MAAREKYKIGDLFEVEIDLGLKGCGRILAKDPEVRGVIFVELYKITPSEVIAPEKLSNLEPVVMFWTGIRGFKEGTWKVIGHIPVDPNFELPALWITDALDKTKIIITKNGQKHIANKGEEGNAQPDGTFGIGAARMRYAFELKKIGLWNYPVPNLSPRATAITNLFNEDVAMDVQVLFKDTYKKSKDADTATQAVMECFREALSDQDDAPLIYLTLASLQLKYKSLREDIKRKSLEIIDSGEFLKRWEEDPASAKEYKKVLEGLRAELEKSGS